VGLVVCVPVDSDFADTVGAVEVVEDSVGGMAL
jgi:hypothetical protein